MAKRSGVGTVFSNREGVQLMTAEQALAALKTGDPIHVSGDEMRRFIAAVTVRRSVITEH